MLLKYKNNCHLYYENQASMINLVKRDTRYKINDDFDSYTALKDIIEKTVKPCPVEDILSDCKINRTKVLQYIKLLLDKDIIYKETNDSYNIEENFKEYIISNFEKHDEVLRTLENSIFLLVNCPKEVNNYFTQLLLTVHIIEEEDLKHYLLTPNTVIIGDVENSTVKYVLNHTKDMLLLKEVNNVFSLFYAKEYNEEVLHIYKNFYINCNEDYDLSRTIMPLNLLIHLIHNRFNLNNKNFKYIASDGAVHLFNIENLSGTSSLKYYERKYLSEKSPLETIQQFENLQKEIPYIITAINNKNTIMLQSPIFNYQIDFSSWIDGQACYGYNEDYSKAALNAIINGLEHCLCYEEKNPEVKWVCSNNLESYYLKGMISMLPEEDSYISPVATCNNQDITRLLSYIEKSYEKRLRVYYKDIYNKKIVKIIILDENNAALYEGKASEEITESILNGLYEIIGKMQNNTMDPQGVHHKITLQHKLIIENTSKVNLLEELKDYFSSKSIIINEEPWSYQSIFERTGLYIGRFNEVR